MSHYSTILGNKGGPLNIQMTVPQPNQWEQFALTTEKPSCPQGSSLTSLTITENNMSQTFYSCVGDPKPPPHVDPNPPHHSG